MNICSKRSAAGKEGRREKIEMRAVRLISIFFFLFLPYLTACYSVDPVIKIGLVAPFEGENRALGYDAIYAARLAVRQVNEAGGIGGYRLALVALDDSGDTGLAQGAAKALVADPGVVAVVGHGLGRQRPLPPPFMNPPSRPHSPGRSSLFPHVAGGAARRFSHRL
ncbi:MAG: ABC transporter substrate-binding protein [Chloroflexi bacterium]|nr:ABC transporter substrate-binding protein [Chloroflexota bacterium]